MALIGAITRDEKARSAVRGALFSGESFEVSRWRLRRTRHPQVCILNGVLVLMGQPERCAAMACGGVTSTSEREVSDLQGALLKYALRETALDQAIPVPAAIEHDVYLVGQDQVSNLTYLIDCGPEGVAIIDLTYESRFERTLAIIKKCGFPRLAAHADYIVRLGCCRCGGLPLAGS